MRSYICESDVSPADIKAALENETMEFWRTDADGRRWFKATRPAKKIRGVPPGFVAGDGDDNDGLIEATRRDPAERALWRYRRLVEARSTGRDIPPQLGAEVLAAADKTMDDFAADVAEAAEVLAELGDDFEFEGGDDD